MSGRFSQRLHLGFFGFPVICVHAFKKSDLFHHPDLNPVDVEFIPCEAVFGGTRESVMIVMPSLTKGHGCNKRVIARIVTGFETPCSPEVCRRIDEPCEM